MKGTFLFLLFAVTFFACMLTFLSATAPDDPPSKDFKHWTPEKIQDESDLIIIGKVFKASPSNEKIDMMQQGIKGYLDGIDTVFDVQLIIKGKPDKQIAVRTYALKIQAERFIDAIVEDGPATVAFRSVGKSIKIDDVPKYFLAPSYLLYLKKLKDGRYDPVTGHYDPRPSIREINEPWS